MRLSHLSLRDDDLHSLNCDGCHSIEVLILNKAAMIEPNSRIILLLRNLFNKFNG